jgi:GR25 family glycosyltransferase involved in LPS biosynthesis
MQFHIIRLKKNEISEKHAKECVKQAKQFGYDVNYFDAINGNKYEAYINHFKIAPKYKFKKGRVGVHGCFLSHYHLWKACVKANETFCILEHDGYFVKPLPDDVENKFTDVLKLDGHDPYSGNYNKIFENEQSIDNVEINQYYNSQAKATEKNGTGNYLRGAYGYLIKPHAADKIIRWIDANGYLPADIQIGSAIVDIKVTQPSVVRLHPAYFKKVGELSLTGNPNLI